MHETLSSLLLNADARLVLEHGDEATVVSGVTVDSRTVRFGNVFIACSGDRFIQDAIDRGATVVVASREVLVPLGPTVVRCDHPLAAAGALAHAFCGAPSAAMKVIGVTGTNGKTTTATFLKHLFDTCGEPCGLVGTVEWNDGLHALPSTMTTPDAVTLAQHLAQMRANGCSAAAIEVSSHGLSQHRTAGISFAAGVFTNLTGDHLDYHGSMEAYAHAKGALFRELEPDAIAVVNGADPYAEAVLDGCTAKLIRVVVGSGGPCDLRVISRNVDVSGMDVCIESKEFGDGSCRVPLVGLHNAFNVGATIATAVALGVPLADALRSMETATAPRGRLEPVHYESDDVRVFVDYAHTDDALANVLQAVRSVVPPNNALRVVFGAGGDRDRSKRSRMAACACAGADFVVVTSDNPRTEDPKTIVDDILLGVPVDAIRRVNAEVDRRAAINQVIDDANAGDVLVIAGKGHEAYQVIGTEKRPFDDVGIAREALARRRGGAP